MAYVRALKAAPILANDSIAIVSRSFEQRKAHIVETILSGRYIEGGPPVWRSCSLGQTCLTPLIVWIINSTVEGTYMHDRLKFVFVVEEYPSQEDLCPEWWAVDMLNNGAISCMSVGDVFSETKHLAQTSQMFSWQKFALMIDLYGVDTVKQSFASVETIIEMARTANLNY